MVQTRCRLGRMGKIARGSSHCGINASSGQGIGMWPSIDRANPEKTNSQPWGPKEGDGVLESILRLGIWLRAVLDRPGHG